VRRSARRARTISASKPAGVAVATAAPPFVPISAAVPAARQRPWQLLGFFAFAFGSIALGGLLITAVDAATFTPPSASPPGGNIPVTIWNRAATGAKQTSAAIEIDGAVTADGGIVTGTEALDLGNGAGGQNVIFGVADFAGMHAADYLLRLQTENAGVYTDRFRVDKNGAVITPSNITASGSLTANGTASIGFSGLNLNVANTGQNVIYGVSRYEFTHPTGDYLLKLQTYTGGVFTDRATINRDGDLAVTGAVNGSGCFGRQMVGVTVSTYPGNTGSYYAAYNRCNTDFPGSHVCTVEEILESIQCSAGNPSAPIRNNEGQVAWINGGPPGFTANANDCIGWTSNASNAYGRVWVFNNTTGGNGTQTSCNTPGLKFACCR
jgi:hypothetical protein